VKVDSAARNGPLVFILTPSHIQAHWSSDTRESVAFAEFRSEIIGWMNSEDAYADQWVVGDVVGGFRVHSDVDVAYGHAVPC
jgi:hypothetical protein